MTSSDATFRVLALCARPPNGLPVEEPLRRAAASIASWDALVADAEEHGLEPLLSEHLRQAEIEVPVSARTRLRVRCVQHAHACTVRMRLMDDVLRTMAQRGIRPLVLKGGALAHIAYPSPRLRPMRDVDLLVSAGDAGAAWRCLHDNGFVPAGALVDPRYHHLQALSKTVDGVTITIEIHRALLRSTPLLASLEYEALAARAQRFTWGDVECLTLGPEDMLWHVYAHAFAINVLRPGIRLVSVADLVTLTEAWADVIDWAAVEQDRARLFRALPLIHHLTPWSARVLTRLRVDVPLMPVPVRPTTTRTRWQDALSPDVWWPSRWWFDVRYGIDGAPRRVWHRLAVHPACLVMAAARTATTRHHLPPPTGLRVRTGQGRHDGSQEAPRR